MREEAAAAGFDDGRWDGPHPRVHILAIEELPNGKRIPTCRRWAT